jgi:hypothetical protein
MLKFALIFILSTSCALFKADPSLKKSEIEALLSSVKIIGEGRGRLSLEPNQHLFSFESLLNDKPDWIMAVSIPLHGEELLIFNDILHQHPRRVTQESFEARMRGEINQKGPPADLVIKEMRTFVRFILAQKIGLDRSCRQLESSRYACRFEGQVFQILVQEQKLIVQSKKVDGHYLELSAENLTDSFFKRTNFHFKRVSLASRSAPIMTLELFWK